MRPGVEIGADGTRFHVHAPSKSGIWLCLFDGDGGGDGEGEDRVAMTRDGDGWTATADAPPGTRYGYRTADDPDRLLVDPYAVELDRRFTPNGPVPRAIVQPATETVAPPPPLFTPGGLIYEINVRGFTMRHPAVPEAQCGTVAALAHPAVIAHLRKLRVAAVELMPIVAWIDERHLPPLGLRNAWGYNPVVPMALDPGLCPGGVAELRKTIAALRAAGIGTILDLVFNHSGESDAQGPTLAMRGFDPDYYARAPDGTLINDTGTGNTLDFAQPVVRRLTLDSLRHFASLGVDGFRFDLATVLARGPGFDPHAPIFTGIATDPLLCDRIMIAEPWDTGPGGYQLGAFPANWLEWNDRYRDDVRRFWRGDGTAGVLATRIAGSSDIFTGQSTRSVGFVAAHDGFTLADLVTYAGRHNHANGEDNRDGHAGEIAWNNGIEGPSDDPAIHARRDADIRALLATLFASKGTILLTAGDEFGRTQGGNNNAYAQDNATTWLDWSGRDTALEEYVAMLADWRAGASIAAPAFLTDAEWRDLDGAAMSPDRWDRAQGFELRLADATIRVDRPARHVTVG